MRFQVEFVPAYGCVRKWVNVGSLAEAKAVADKHLAETENCGLAHITVPIDSLIEALQSLTGLEESEWSTADGSRHCRVRTTGMTVGQDPAYADYVSVPELLGKLCLSNEEVKKP